jgi:hypothetical protein
MLGSRLMNQPGLCIGPARVPTRARCPDGPRLALAGVRPGGPPLATPPGGPGPRHHAPGARAAQPSARLSAAIASQRHDFGTQAHGDLGPGREGTLVPTPWPGPRCTLPGRFVRAGGTRTPSAPRPVPDRPAAGRGPHQAPGSNAGAGRRPAGSSPPLTALPVPHRPAAGRRRPIRSGRCRVSVRGLSGRSWAAMSGTLRLTAS